MLCMPGGIGGTPGGKAVSTDDVVGAICEASFPPPAPPPKAFAMFVVGIVVGIVGIEGRESVNPSGGAPLLVIVLMAGVVVAAAADTASAEAAAEFELELAFVESIIEVLVFVFDELDGACCCCACCCCCCCCCETDPAPAAAGPAAVFAVGSVAAVRELIDWSCERGIKVSPSTVERAPWATTPCAEADVAASMDFGKEMLLEGGGERSEAAPAELDSAGSTDAPSSSLSPEFIPTLQTLAFRVSFYLYNICIIISPPSFSFSCRSRLFLSNASLGRLSLSIPSLSGECIART
mmetsp:Transcript_14639/g.26349  ORF Transcript_14639/g.26349 Transcript_14639/m.26349 type:complete len:294 (-) Transcript_14639:48-929(-)